MGLFNNSKIKKCPQEEDYFKVYGIPAPEKWHPEFCQHCPHQEDRKCQYKKNMAHLEENRKRGHPVLMKRVNMTSAAEQRKKAESEALKNAGLSVDEQKEYWIVSTQIDISWEKAGTDDRRELLDHLDQWKVHLEKGLRPLAAYDQVKIWLQQREEFRKGL
jgi:hypothetical protein